MFSWCFMLSWAWKTIYNLGARIGSPTELKYAIEHIDQNQGSY